MPIPERTTAGIQNEEKFYSGQFVVYVEGPDDVPFWGLLFPPRHGDLVAHIKPVGGRPALERYAGVIEATTGRALVAMDSDFDVPLGRQVVRRRVVRTGYYSIENVFLCPCRLGRWLSALWGIASPPAAELLEWLNAYDNAIGVLMAAQIIGIEGQRELQEEIVRIARYLNETGDVNETEIRRVLTDAGRLLAEIEERMVSLRAFPPRYYFCGHSLLTATSYFARGNAKMRRGRAVSVSDDALVAAMLGAGTTCFRCQPKWDALTREVVAALELLVDA